MTDEVTRLQREIELLRAENVKLSQERDTSVMKCTELTTRLETAESASQVAQQVSIGNK